jgi:hypothetical protein
VRRVGGDLLDQLQLAAGVQLARVRADRLHLDPGHRLGRGDQHVRRATGGQLHRQVVHGQAVRPLDDVHPEDVDTGHAECGGHGAQTARLVRQHDAEQERHAAQPSSTDPSTHRPNVAGHGAEPSRHPEHAIVSAPAGGGATPSVVRRAATRRRSTSRFP